MVTTQKGTYTWTSTPPPPPPPPPSSGIQLMTIFFENKPAAIWSGSNFQKLKTLGAFCSNYHGASHPSAPNYAAIVSGNIWVTSDVGCGAVGSHTTVAHLAKAKGVAWAEYEEDYPKPDGACYGTGPTCTTGTLYCCKHDFFNLFSNISSAGCNISGFKTGSTSITGKLATDLASGTVPPISFLTPNMNNDGHSCTTCANPWLGTFLTQLQAAPQYKAGTLQVFITFDEGNDTTGNLTYAALIGGKSQIGKTFSTSWNHYNWLATIESIFGLGDCGQHDHGAATMASLFTSTS